MKEFRSFIEKYVKLPDADWQLVAQFFERREFIRNSHILRESEICRHFYFLENGLIRFYSTVEGNDITKAFAIAPFCFTAKVSFRKQLPSEEGIQVLDRAVVWQISYQDYRKLEELHSWNLFMRQILNEIQEYTDKLFLETRTMTAETRYQKLYQTYPASLIQKIPLKHLSSFFGIAPQSLSRIRKKIHTGSKKLT